MAKARSTTDLLDCISNSWIMVFGSMRTLTLDGGSGMRAKDVDDWAMYNHVALKRKAPHQKAWLVERHNALIRSALQRAESQAIKESLRASFVTLLGLLAFMHSALTRINSHTPYQAPLGRQLNLLPPLEGCYFGDLDVMGQNHLARVREINAVAILDAAARHRLQRGDKHQQVVTTERAEHRPGDLVDIWYDPPHTEAMLTEGVLTHATPNKHASFLKRLEANVQPLDLKFWGPRHGP